MALFFYFRLPDRVEPMTADRLAKATIYQSDAGTDDGFVVEAETANEALRGAREWIANRADDDADCVPDGMSLFERQWGPRDRDTHIALLVS